MSLLEDLENLQTSLESFHTSEESPVSKYYQSLLSGSTPESATSELFISLVKELFKEESKLISQVRRGNSVIDFVQEEKSYKVAIELKAPFRRVKGKIERRNLNVENHLEQVKKYLQSGFDYLILTDLYDWVFFSRSSLLGEKLLYFSRLSLKDFREFVENKNLRSFIGVCRQLERTYPLKNLDKYFFRDLKNYVKEFEHVIEDQEKAVKIVNSLIFLRTLEDTGVVDYKRLENRFKTWENDHGENSKKVFNLLICDVKDFYYDYFDTDLFRWEEILSSLPNDKQVEFLKTFKRVMGFDKYTEAFYMGLKFYNFEALNEDVFGKSY